MLGLFVSPEHIYLFNFQSLLLLVVQVSVQMSTKLGLQFLPLGPLFQGFPLPFALTRPSPDPLSTLHKYELHSGTLFKDSGPFLSWLPPCP